MVSEDHQHDPPPLPQVADRRAPERRSYALPTDARPQLASTGAAAAMALSGGLAVLFVFFWVLGAIDVTSAVAATVVAAVLALVWAAGFAYRRRPHTDAREVLRRDRERRGF